MGYKIRAGRVRLAQCIPGGQMMWKVALILVAAAPLLVQAFPSEDVRSKDLKLEHRTAEDVRLDIVSDLPAATDDMFIWRGPNGTYKFGMQTPDQWRVESRDSDGNVKGHYSYKTPEGEMVDVSYTSGADGYRAEGDAIPGGVAGHSAKPVVKFSLPVEKSTLEVENFSPDMEQAQEDEDVIPYGALRKAGERLTLPNGPGVSTVEDNDIQVIVTEVKEELFALREEPIAPEAQSPENEIPLADQEPFNPEGEVASPPIAFFPVFPGQTPEGRPVVVVGAPHIPFGPAVVRPVSSGVIEA
ncbi:uncharacterized protein LOC143032147 [Oratosquilla oratoria]|uniref:uncharacterized protein LOC143032147 n=1 Tax=Oratosquilla oratoria TaxID=337810 RepID=UPI003F76AFA0